MSLGRELPSPPTDGVTALRFWADSPLLLASSWDGVRGHACSCVDAGLQQHVRCPPTCRTSPGACCCCAWSACPQPCLARSPPPTCPPRHCRCRLLVSTMPTRPRCRAPLRRGPLCWMQCLRMRGSSTQQALTMQSSGGCLWAAALAAGTMIWLAQSAQLHCCLAVLLGPPCGKNIRLAFLAQWPMHNAPCHRHRYCLPGAGMTFLAGRRRCWGSMTPQSSAWSGCPAGGCWSAAAGTGARLLAVSCGCRL